MKIIFSLIFVATLVFANPDWESFKLKNNLKFERIIDDKVHYLNYWQDKIKREKHNADEKATFKMAENQFSHMSFKEVSDNYLRTILPEEFKGKKKRNKRQTITTTLAPTSTTKRPSTNIFGNYDSSNLPAFVDYTYLMQPMVNQGKCGSCWAIAAMAQVEAIMKFKNSSFNTVLSPQYMMDCDQWDFKCGGGWPYSGLKWLRNSTANGRNMAPSITNYPYLAANDTCKNSTTNFIPLGLKTAKQTIFADESILQTQLANCGPQVVTFWASDNFLRYGSGVYTDDNCFTGNCDEINHSMLVIGYGTDPQYGDYWLAKNTWGEGWGEKGYVRMARNRGNMCNIACFLAFAQ